LAILLLACVGVDVEVDEAQLLDVLAGLGEHGGGAATVVLGHARTREGERRARGLGALGFVREGEEAERGLILVGVRTDGRRVRRRRNPPPPPL
jgi:hypothetical protein